MLRPFFSSSLLVRSGISTAFSSGHLTIVVFRLGYVASTEEFLKLLLLLYASRMIWSLFSMSSESMEILRISTEKLS
jgi:hypothetical protein